MVIVFSDTGPHISGLIWAFLLVSAAVVITIPTSVAIKCLVFSFVLRMIASLGPEFTLTLLALAIVSALLSLENKLPNMNYS